MPTQMDDVKTLIASYPEQAKIIAQYYKSDDDAVYGDEQSNARWLAVRTMYALAGEAVRLHEGEAPFSAYEGEAPTPQQWLTKFNELKPGERILWIKKIIENGERAHECFTSAHETLIEQLKAENLQLRNKVAQLAAKESPIIATVQVDLIKRFGRELIKSDVPSRRQIGEELLHTIGEKINGR